MTSTQMQMSSPIWGRLWRAGLAAAGIAAIGNALLYLIAGALGAMPQTVLVASPGGTGPITLASVILMSLMPAVVATLLLALLIRFTPRPGLIFGILAVCVFVGMFFGPLSIPGAPPGMILTLELMHLVTAVVIVGSLLGILPRS